MIQKDYSNEEVYINVLYWHELHLVQQRFPATLDL